ncbi:uncharacterized protein [Periplaneta americana]|uniref:uncharacterized protein n=1 Tax=Periplaneta americana TaxID=6978 RepID=UPI0037E8BB7B
MAVNEMKREIDPLATDISNNTAIEKEKPLSEEGQFTGIKTECMDHSYDVQSEMTFDETPVPIDSSSVKSEVEEEKVFDLHVIEIKTEYMDHSYDLKSEITYEKTPVSIDCPIVKSEAEEETFDMARVKQENKLDVAVEESEVLTES